MAIAVTGRNRASYPIASSKGLDATGLEGSYFMGIQPPRVRGENPQYKSTDHSRKQPDYR